MSKDERQLELEPKARRKCEYSKCGVPFVPNRPHQRFCCTEHRFAAWYEKRPEHIAELERRIAALESKASKKEKHHDRGTEERPVCEGVPGNRPSES